MATIPEQSIAALLGLVSGLVGGYLSGRRQTKLDREKEARLAVAELARHLGAANHAMGWLTWKAANRPSHFQAEDLHNYDKEIHALFPAVTGAMAVVAAMSGRYYSLLKPLTKKTFAMDVELANAGTRYLDSPGDGLKDLSALLHPVVTFNSELNSRVTEIMDTGRR